MIWNRHPLEELHDLVTGRVPAEERSSIEQHVESCLTCGAELSRIIATRDVVRRLADTESVPPELQSRVAAAVRSEIKPARAWWRRPAFALSATAAAIALLLLVRPWRQPTFPDDAADDYAAVVSGQRPLEIQTTDTAQLERWLDERLPFRSRVFDFAMMRYTLLGGRVDSLGRRPSALFTYRGERGDRIVCQMYEGRTAELPPAAQTRVHNDITFHIYEREGRTIVFWQEGEVVCVLAGEGGAENVIALAFAKAMKV
jgi:anti-sigma factor RsiW